METQVQPQPRHLQSLVDLLNSWQPLSQGFRITIKSAMQALQVHPKQQLFSPGSHLQYAWYSIDCWIAAHRIMEEGKEEVSAFHRPNSIFTDIGSFLKGETSHQKLVVINGTNLLKIDRQHFNLLRLHPETPLLLEHYLLDQQYHDQWRLDLMSLSDKKKFNSFAVVYPVNELPGKLCASFLRMTPSRYSAAKKLYNRIR